MIRSNLIITLIWEYVYVQSYENSYLFLPHPQLGLRAFYDSLGRQMCSLRQLSSHKTQMERSFGNCICASFKLQPHELNTCFCPKSSTQDGVNSLLLKMKDVASFCVKPANLFTQESYEVYAPGEE